MDEKAFFNASVCILGIGILLIHSVDLLFKKNKRNDEKFLLAFFLFTALHFAIYLTFTLIKSVYTSDPFIMGFYTAFYCFNNLELLFLYAYAISHMRPRRKIVAVSTAIVASFLTVFLALDIGNIFGHYFFYAQNGAYVRAPTMFFAQSSQFVVLVIVFLLAMTNKRISVIEKTAFGIYCLLPLAAIILQTLLPGYAIAYLSIIMAIEILFVYASNRKNAIIAREEQRVKEAEIRIMMSQIQPHFIYNTLSSISTLIKLNPEKAEEALDEFTEYLRANLSALSTTHPIPFSEELRHIETYLALEAIRFGERLNVVYEITDVDFHLPSLSLQPLVENAVKHGILQRIEGGTVTIKTHLDDNTHVVEIIDDGVGFDVEEIKNPETEHIGLQNVSSRLRTMANATMSIESEIGKGTKVTVKFLSEANQ